MILGVVVLAPIAYVVGFFIYARMHPEAMKRTSVYPDPGPPAFVTSVEGVRDKVDSTLVLESLDSGGTGFSHWRGGRTVIYYFSVTCLKCQKDFPLIQKLADSLATRGIETIALAIRDNSHADIKEFAKIQQSHMRIYHDEGRLFGDRYGTRIIPLTLLIDTSGAYMKLSGFKITASLDRIRMGLDMMMASRSAVDTGGG